MSGAAAVETWDVLVIGSGPAGQKAAIQAAKGGLRVAVCEQLREVGGACVQYGTIPSKALREAALRRFAEGGGGSHASLDQSVSVPDLIGEVGEVVRAHDRYMSGQLRREGVDIIHGRVSFESATRLQIAVVGGGQRRIDARIIVVATGSVPRLPTEVAVDHEHVYDSDSVLTLAYLPRSMVVLGGGVIACEYASIFALLGVEVTLVDRASQPLGFLDVDLRRRFLEAFQAMGGRFYGDTRVLESAFDGIAGVTTRLACGRLLQSDKVLCALGRVSSIAGLAVERAGIRVDERGLIQVDEHGRTSVRGIYAAGDVIGPPALASASMEQGRRVGRHLLDLDQTPGDGIIPTGIYAVPELSSVGLTEAEARDAYAGVVVGETRFCEIAKGQIAGTQTGYLKLVVSADRRIRGLHLAGDQATELVHLGQMALIQQATLDVFIDNVFNFPTYGEAFRVAALHAADALARAGSRS